MSVGFRIILKVTNQGADTLFFQVDLEFSVMDIEGERTCATGFRLFRIDQATGMIEHDTEAILAHTESAVSVLFDAIGEVGAGADTTDPFLCKRRVSLIAAAGPTPLTYTGENIKPDL
jgi:hypothetical protein